MEEPLTEELLQELLSAPDVKSFCEEHRIQKRSLSDYLQQQLDEKGLERAAVVRAAGINDTFGYQIFMGQRGASRNKVLQLAFAMELTLKEANRLLQAAGTNELYCKNRRDAIIIFCLDHGYKPAEGRRGAVPLRRRDHLLKAQKPERRGAGAGRFPAVFPRTSPARLSASATMKHHA